MFLRVQSVNEVVGSPEWALLEGRGPPPQPCTLLRELVTIHTADWCPCPLPQLGPSGKERPTLTSAQSGKPPGRT